MTNKETKYKDLMCCTYFPFKRNDGYYASLELVRRGKRKIVNWGTYKFIGLYIETDTV